MISNRYKKPRSRGGIRAAAAWSAAILILMLPSVLSAAGTVRVGIYPNEPLIFTGRDGRVQGIYNDILLHVAHKENWTLKYVPGSWGECITRLNNHEIDLMAAIAYSESRRLIYDFNRVTVIENWGQIYLPEDSEVAAFLDLTGRQMAVLKDDIYFNTFRDLGARFEIRPEFVEVDSYLTIFEMLDRGAIASGIVSRIFGQYHDDRYRIKTSQMNFGPVELRFAIPKGRTRTVLDAIDKHLEPLKLRKNSIYHQSLDRWLEGSSKIVLPAWLNPAWVVGSIAGLVLFIGSVSLFLRRQLRLRTAALEKTIAAKECIESDLRVAREIQMDLLPTEFPPFPDRHEFDIFAVIEPAREVGGDLFDFFFVDDDHLCFVIGDVSDKGVPAALFMARTKTLIKSMAGGQQNSAQILTAVNRELSVNNDSMMFVTTFCGILKVSTGEIEYTNAGHNPPLVVTADKAPHFIADTGDTALGIDEDLTFHAAELTLAPGDTLFMYTDGVTEAFNDRQEEFSEARLQQALSSQHAGEVSETAQAVLGSVKRFAGEVPQSDDIAILALKYLKS